MVDFEGRAAVQWHQFTLEGTEVQSGRISHPTNGYIQTTLAVNKNNDVVIGFQVVWVALFYLGAMAFLSLHLYHGAWASFRTLGIARPSDHPLHRRLALALAIAVPAGLSLIPLSVLLGFVR